MREDIKNMAKDFYIGYGGHTFVKFGGHNNWSG